MAENSQVIALVAIAISLVGLVLAFVTPITLQSDIRNLSNDFVEQSQTIKSLSSELNITKQLASEQKVTIDNLLSAQNDSEVKINSLQTDAINMQNEISQLESRIATLEQRMSIPPPLPSPKFQAKTLTDANGIAWTSGYIRVIPNPVCDYVIPEGYINMNEISTPYGKGISVDTSNSDDYCYYFFAHTNKYVAPSDGIIKISGKFLKNDDFYLSGLQSGRSNLDIYLMPETATSILNDTMVLTDTDTNGIWYDKEITFKLKPGEIFIIGIGRSDMWSTDYHLTASWSSFSINAKTYQDLQTFAATG